MSEQRNVVSRVLAAVWALLMARPAGGSFLSRQRRWVTGAISALAVSGLLVGGLAGPAAAAGLPSNVVLEQWTDVNMNWVTGDLGLNGANASTYKEGETVPFRLDVTTAGEGTFNFSVCRDFSDGSIRGYLGLTPVTTSRLPLIGAAITSSASAGQPFTGAALGGTVTIDSSHEVGGPGACGPNQHETQVQITVAGAVPGVAPLAAYVLWGGRLASPADAGVGPAHGASHFHGGSLSMQLLSPAKNRSIKTDAIIQLGTITVQKVVDSGTASADQFCFNISPNPTGVALPQCPTSGQSTVAFVGLPTGSYSVTEAGLAGYSFASGLGSTANCGISNGVATAAVTAANTPTDATCVFHNRRQTGTLTVNEVLAPASDPGLFNLQIDGATAGSGANVGNGGTTGAVTVASDSHPVGAAAGTGTNLADYTASVSCVDSSGPVAVSSGSVAVADGQDVVCTVTLTPIPAVVPTTTSTTTTTVPEPTTTTTLPEPTTTTTLPEPTTTTTLPEPTTTTTLPEPTTTTTTLPEPTTTTTTTVPDPVVTTTSTTTTTLPDPVIVVDPLPDPVVTTTSTTTTTTTAHPRPKPTDDDGPGDDGPLVPGPDTPAPSTTTTTTTTAIVDPVTTVAGGGEQATPPAPVDQVLGNHLDRSAPAPADPAPAGPPPGGLLPRTGAGIAGEAGLAFALLAAGLAILRLARRRRPAPRG